MAASDRRSRDKSNQQAEKIVATAGNKSLPPGTASADPELVYAAYSPITPPTPLEMLVCNSRRGAGQRNAPPNKAFRLDGSTERWCILTRMRRCDQSQSKPPTRRGGDMDGRPSDTGLSRSWHSTVAAAVMPNKGLRSSCAEALTADKKSPSQSDDCRRRRPAPELIARTSAPQHLRRVRDPTSQERV